MSAWIDAKSGNLRKLIALTRSDNLTVRNTAVKAISEQKDWSGTFPQYFPMVILITLKIFHRHFKHYFNTFEKFKLPLFSPDAAYETFSKLCDNKAVVGLARTKNADPRLLKKPSVLEPCEVRTLQTHPLFRLVYL